MTKEEVLQAATNYCDERRYNQVQLTITDEFKDKFADFFVKKNPDGDINDENILADLKFNIDTAYSASIRSVDAVSKTFSSKEDEYKTKIAELTKQIGNGDGSKHEIPKEVLDQLEELKKFKNEEAKKDKYKNIIKIAEEGIRTDLHKSFENYAREYQVALDKDDKEQAQVLVSRFQEIFKDSIGDIKPLAPKQVQQRENEFIASVPKVKVQ